MMTKKAILLALLGYLAGCIIGLCFALRNETFVIGEALPKILLGGIPGAIAMGSVVVYDIEKWSLARATATHFLITMGAILLACFVLKWFKPWSLSFWLMLSIEVVGYFIIWLVIYLHYKAQIRELNELLKKNKKEQEE